MEDYPRTLEEFEGRFATEQACREYLMQLRWPQGFVCPRCGGRRARPGRERLSGRVEVDETYVGGAEEGLRGRQTQKKALVAIAAEEDGAVAVAWLTNPKAWRA